MTAAEGAAPLPIRGRAALVVATLGLAASGCRPTPVEALVLPNLTDDRWSGETLDLAVQGTTAGFEFRFWVHEDGAWTVRREYAAEPGFRFAPTSHGLRSFQVDVRRTGAAEPLRQHWIGQKFVGPRDASSPLLRDVLLAPPALRLPLGSRVAIYARPNAPLTLDDLECRVLDSETPLGAWRNWPPEPLVLDRPGESRFALQVRQRGQTAIETHTLGPLQALEEQDSPSLFRLCAAELPTTLPESEAWATLAVRLAIAHHAMANEHDAGDDEALITRLRGVARVDATGTPWTLTPSRGAALHFDPRARSLRTANGPQSIDLHVATWPGHRELLATTRGFAEPSRLCADLAFAVFGAYRYGTPPAGPGAAHARQRRFLRDHDRGAGRPAPGARPAGGALLPRRRRRRARARPVSSGAWGHVDPRHFRGPALPLGSGARRPRSAARTDGLPRSSRTRPRTGAPLLPCPHPRAGRTAPAPRDPARARRGEPTRGLSAGAVRAASAYASSSCST